MPQGIIKATSAIKKNFWISCQSFNLKPFCQLSVNYYILKAYLYDHCLFDSTLYKMRIVGLGQAAGVFLSAQLFVYNFYQFLSLFYFPLFKILKKELHLPSPHTKTHDFFLARSPQIAPPWSTKSAIWGNRAKIGHGFSYVEREDVIHFFKFWRVEAVMFSTKANCLAKNFLFEIFRM